MNTAAPRSALAQTHQAACQGQTKNTLDRGNVEPSERKQLCVFFRALDGGRQSTHTALQ